MLGRRPVDVELKVRYFSIRGAVPDHRDTWQGVLRDQADDNHDGTVTPKEEEAYIDKTADSFRKNLEPDARGFSDTPQSSRSTSLGVRQTYWALLCAVRAARGDYWQNFENATAPTLKQKWDDYTKGFDEFIKLCTDNDISREYLEKGLKIDEGTTLLGPLP